MKNRIMKVIFASAMLVLTPYTIQAMKNRGINVNPGAAPTPHKKAATPQALHEVAISMGAAGRLENQKESLKKAVPIADIQADQMTSAIFDDPISAAEEGQQKIAEINKLKSQSKTGSNQVSKTPAALKKKPRSTAPPAKQKSIGQLPASPRKR